MLSKTPYREIAACGIGPLSGGLVLNGSVIPTNKGPAKECRFNELAVSGATRHSTTLQWTKTMVNKDGANVGMMRMFISVATYILYIPSCLKSAENCRTKHPRDRSVWWPDGQGDENKLFNSFKRSSLALSNAMCCRIRTAT